MDFGLSIRLDHETDIGYNKVIQYGGTKRAMNRHNIFNLHFFKQNKIIGIL